MPFTPTELRLLSQGYYGAPGLAGWLERLLDEGPGEDGHRTRPAGPFAPDELPLHERVWAELWHQGTVYPASYVAVPVLVEVIGRFPDASAPLIVHVTLIEESRRLFRQTSNPDLATLPDDVGQKYRAALTRLADLNPGLLRGLPGKGEEADFSRGRELLGCLAAISGQPLLSRLVAETGLIGVDGEVNRVLLDFEERTGDRRLSRRLRAEAARRARELKERRRGRERGLGDDAL